MSDDGVAGRFHSPDRVLDGVASFTMADRQVDVIEPDRLARLLHAMESTPLPVALDDVLTGSDDRDRFLKRLFRPGAESWRLLVADALGGDCLDLNAGFGTRALLLAEVDGVDAVYAVDDRLDPLRFLDRRTDYDRTAADSEDVPSAPVVPIHASPTDLPIPEQRFDTVVVDLSTVGRPEILQQRITRAAEFVADDGALVALIDGPARLTGLTRLLGVETPGSRRIEPRPGDLPSAIRATPGRYRRLFGTAGFSEVEFQALVPSTTDPKYGFPLSAPPAVDSLLATRNIDTSPTARVLRMLLRRKRVLQLLQRSYPSYVAVCRREGADESSAGTAYRPFAAERGDLAVRGRSRTVVVEHERGEIARVRKVPHRRTHAPFVTNEWSVPAHIEQRGVDEWVQESIPDGRVEPSRFGPTYVEPPAMGDKLATRISDDPDEFRAALSAGFDWIVALQRSTRGADRHVDADAIRSELSIPHLDLAPPSVPDSLDLFSTPIHGDLQPGNVYVRAGNATSRGRDASVVGPNNRGYEVGTVIDWEYAAVDGNPIVDPAFHVLWTAGLAFDGLYNGIRRALIEDTTHSRIVSELVGWYCDAVGLDPRVFVTYLPYVWIRRQQYCAEIGATMHYTGQGRRRAKVVEHLWEHREAIGETLGVALE